MQKKKKQQNSDEKIKILIVDDHSIVRKGLMQLINEEPDLVVCAEAENAAQALEAIEEKQIDLAIVDISLDGTNGIRLTEKIKSQRPHLPVLILTIHDEALYAKRAFQAGATGYVTKQEAAETIITAIRLMLSGKDYIGETMTQKLLKNLHSANSRC
jgi:DNA-binding NarL/FixJ family response regulator